MLTSKAKWMLDSEGAWVSFLASTAAEARQMAEAVTAEMEITVQKPSKRRSKNANDYLWVLCTKIAEKLRTVTKEEVYRSHIKDFGKCDFVAVADRAADTLQKMWAAHGIGWFTEKVDNCKIDGCSKVCLYYGSSTYDTAEMSRLIDGIVETAKEIGVEVISDRELSLLKEEWK